MEEDKVWFQPLNGNAWIGPALVVTQRGQCVYLHTHGDPKKIAACRVKPFQLVNTDEHTQNTKEVMQEVGLEDVENLYTAQLNKYYYTKKHNVTARNNTHNNTHTDSNTEKHNATARNNMHNKNYTEGHNTHNINYTERTTTHNKINTEEHDTHNKNYT